MKKLSILALCGFLGGILNSSSQSLALPVDEFLDRVKRKNQEIQSAQLRIQSLRLQKEQPGLVFQPQLVGGWDYRDSKETGFLSFLGESDKSSQNAFSVGLQKEWSIGTQTSVTHSFTRYSFDIAGGQNLLTEEEAWENQLELRISQDLWRNFWGREKWQQERFQRLNLEAQALQLEFSIEQVLVQAEQAYWQYILARSITKTLESSLERANGILRWNQKRLKLNLIDEGDFLQSKARVLELKNELVSTRRQEQQAARDLQFFLNNEYDKAPQFSRLSSLSLNEGSFTVPSEWEVERREDLMALRAQKKAAASEAISTKSRLDPTVEFFGAYRADSADPAFSEAQADVIEGNFRSFNVGLNLKIPLGIPKQNKVRQSAEKNARSAQIEYRQKSYKLEKEFLNLKERLSDLEKRIQLAKERKRTETKKLQNEEKRFRQGRSSSFQVLSFQDDLAQAELDLLRLSAEARQFLAQLKTFN